MFDLSVVPWVDVTGYLGAVATVWAMSSRTIIPLRIGVICGNVGFLIFAILTRSYPTMITHAILLPVNIWRTTQLIQLLREIKHSSIDDTTLQPLIQFMRLEKKKAGTVLFRMGDKPDRMVVIKSGTVILQEINIHLGENDVLGEIGIFSPENRRTATAVCKTDCTIYTISHEVMLQLYYQNPRFGLFLVRLIVRRLLQNWKDADERARAGIV